MQSKDDGARKLNYRIKGSFLFSTQLQYQIIPHSSDLAKKIFSSGLVEQENLKIEHKKPSDWTVGHDWKKALE